MYSPPDEDMLEESYNTLYACYYQGTSDLKIIKASSILSVILMQPLPKLPGDPENLWFVIEKSGLDDTELHRYFNIDETL